MSLRGSRDITREPYRLTESYERDFKCLTIKSTEFPRTLTGARGRGDSDAFMLMPDHLHGIVVWPTRPP